MALAGSEAVAGLHDRIAGRRPVLHQMLEQAGQRRQAAADGRSFDTSLLTPHPPPDDDRSVINLAQRVCIGDLHEPHEVAHVELVGAAGLFALLASPARFLLRGWRQAGQGG